MSAASGIRVTRRAAVLGIAFFAACAAAAGAVPVAAPFPIAAAQAAIDPNGNVPFDRVSAELAWRPAAAFEPPGSATALRPLIVWVSIPSGALQFSQPHFLEAATVVGNATLFYRAPGERNDRAIVFGMRIPMQDRALARAIPTIAIPRLAANSTAYVRLAVDEESRVVPWLQVVDASTVRNEDAATARLASIALFFVGIFISLAVANLFVFAFIREWSYVTYSGWMLATALFAATYLHDSSWTWLWAGAAIPETVALTAIVQVQGLLLLAFARSFLDSARIVPRADRIATWAALLCLGAGALLAYVVPSAHVGPAFIGRDVFILTVGIFLLIVFALGLRVALAGSKLARFFVASNVCLLIPGIALSATTFAQHDIQSSSAFVAVLLGEGLEGWLLFGALAFRLRETVREYVDEQQRRIEAQSEALVQAHALLEQRRVAHTDALTGIANRRSFDETLEREWDRCGRSKLPVSLLIGDVDYFKAYNDTYGHVLGDDCLRQVAQALAMCVTRPTDLCARYGGEEFALILAETDEDGALAVAREACEKIRNLRLPHAGSSLGIVTISLGVASTVPHVGGEPSIVEESDRSLYRAKQSGRNRYASANVIDDLAPQSARMPAAN